MDYSQAYIKNLNDGYYRTRKDRGPVASSYSNECKLCTIRRILKSRTKEKCISQWSYPDW